jgi:hypothetical protein
MVVVKLTLLFRPRDIVFRNLLADFLPPCTIFLLLLHSLAQQIIR